METLQAALNAASKGWRVFPIVASGDSWKRPAIANWQLLSTSNPATIRNWWSKIKNITGYGWHTTGFVAVDFDIPGGEQQLNDAGYDTPPTLTITSGNKSKPGRYTIVYRLPDGLRLKVAPLSSFNGFKGFQGIDIRSSGGQIVGPGSAHATGGTYTQNDADAAPAPDWLVALAEMEKPQYSREWTRRELASTERAADKREREAEIANDYATSLRECYPITGPGQRYAITLRASLYLFRQQLNTVEITSLLSDWLEHFRDSYESELDHAIQQMEGIVARTASRLEKGLVTVTDHEKETATLELIPQFGTFLDNLNRGKHQHVDVYRDLDEGNKNGGFDSDEEADEMRKNPQKVDKRRGTRPLSSQAKDFASVILRHIQYFLLVKKDEEVKWTVRQAVRTYELLTGGTMNMKVYYDQCNRFITRIKENGEIIEATHTELLRIVHSSRERGKPSVYEVNPILLEMIDEYRAQQSAPKAGDSEGHAAALQNRISGVALAPVRRTGSAVGVLLEPVGTGGCLDGKRESSPRVAAFTTPVDLSNRRLHSLGTTKGIPPAADAGEPNHAAIQQLMTYFTED